MDGFSILLLITVLISVLFILIFLIIRVFYNIFRSPFKYPYFIYNIDISGKRNPHYEDFIDMFIIGGNFNLIEQHIVKIVKIAKWKMECENKIENSRLKERRRKQYQGCIDDNNAFKFRFMRTRTQYGYQSYWVAHTLSCDYAYLLKRKQQLEAISYQLPLRQYNIKNQRSLMTKELRKTVMERDNYTCQICGKYMPDEVGLQIDHITPVSKGGKTVLSNLQVTCSKCNSRKRDKTDYNSEHFGFKGRNSTDLYLQR